MECSRQSRSPSIPPKSLVNWCFMILPFFLPTKNPTVFFSPVNLTPNGANWVLQLDIKEFEFVLPILLNVLQNVELAYFLTRAIQVNLTVHIKQPCNTLRGLSNKDMVFEVARELSYSSYGSEQPAIACQILQQTPTCNVYSVYV